MKRCRHPHCSVDRCAIDELGDACRLVSMTHTYTVELTKQITATVIVQADSIVDARRRAMEIAAAGGTAIEIDDSKEWDWYRAQRID